MKLLYLFSLLTEIYNCIPYEFKFLSILIITMNLLDVLTQNAFPLNRTDDNNAHLIKGTSIHPLMKLKLILIIF